MRFTLSFLFFLAFNAGAMAQNVFPEAKPKLLPQKCYGNRGGKPVEYLMLHFCSDATKNPASPYELENILSVFKTYGVSAHYIIDREGQVYQLVKEENSAYHAGKGKLPHPPYHENALNSRSIGIEIMGIGSAEDMKKFMVLSHYKRIPAKHVGFTEAQYASLQKLVDDILARNPKIKRDRQHIVGHDEYAPGRRSDPGELFDWSRLGL